MLELIKLVVFFFSSSVFAFSISLFLHEFGHAIFVYFITGFFPQIRFNPLSGGSVLYNVIDPISAFYKTLISGGGIIFGIALGIIIVLFTLRFFRSPWATPFILIGFISTGVNSIMLFVSPFIFNLGDVIKINSLGVPIYVTFLAGGVFLYISLILFIYCMPYFGLDDSCSLKKKCAVILGSVSIYSIIILANTAVVQKEKLLYYSNLIILILLTLLLGISIAHYGQKHFVKMRMKALKIKWIHLSY
ncbi:MAG: hypothetical protein KKD07_02345, partial [Candidatus Omnitrophica bacterium]|nr:hypothetical protein [Candidatus Omnitrophota bacterium]